MSYDNAQFRGEGQPAEVVRLTDAERGRLSRAMSGQMVSVDFYPDAPPVMVVEGIIAARLTAARADERERVAAAFPCGGHGFSPECCFHCQARQTIAGLPGEVD